MFGSLRVGFIHGVKPRGIRLVLGVKYFYSNRAERVSEITERVYREVEVLQTFDKSISRSELDAAVDLSPEDVDEAIEHLVEKNVVDIDQDIIIRKSTNL